MQGKRRRGGQKQEGKKKKQNAGTTSGTSACLHSRVAHIHTLLPPTPPTSLCNLQPKSQRERFSMCTAKQHLISQLKGWLAQRWLRLSLCPTQRTAVSSCWPWALSWLSLSPPPPHPITALYFLYSSLPVSIPPSFLYCTTMHRPCPST